jgi:hypothetical protein
MWWTLVVAMAGLVGLRELGRYTQEHARRAAEMMENPQFRVFEFTQLPPWVQGRLAGLRERFLALGFRELVTYTRLSQRTNYTVVLRSDDGETLVSVWVARYHGLMRWLVILNGWATFRRELAAEARYCLSTEFSATRRFGTSPVEILAKAEVGGEMEFLIVPEEASLAEVVQRHSARARDFAARIGAEPLRVTTEGQFFEVERGIAARMARKLREVVRS